jgi:hypothetical protein
MKPDRKKGRNDINRYQMTLAWKEEEEEED